MTAIDRATIGLDLDEVEAIEKIKNDTTNEAEAIATLTGITVGPEASKARAVHAVFVAGLNAIQEKALEVGYARQAAFEKTHPDCIRWRNAHRSRRHPFFEGHDEAATA